MTDVSDFYQTRWPVNQTWAEPSVDSSLADIFSASGRNQILAHNTFADGAEAASREEAYDRRIEAVRQVTGMRLENPERGGYSIEARRAIRQEVRAGGMSPIDEKGGIPAYQRRIFDQKVAELQQKHPDLEFGDLDEEGKALAAQSSQDLARVMNNPDLNQILKYGAEFAGSMWGSRRDPLFLGSLFAGPATAVGKIAIARIASSALNQGLFNAGLAVVNQYPVQQWNAKIGQETGVAPALNDIGLAFLMGAIPGAAFGAGHEALKAAAPSVRRLFRGEPQPGDITKAVEALGPKPEAPVMTPEEIVAGAASPQERAAVPPEAAPVAAGAAAPPVPDFVKANRAEAVRMADALGLTMQIAEMAKEGKTAKEISEALGGKLSVDDVRAVRESQGIAAAGPLMTPGGAVLPIEPPPAPGENIEKLRSAYDAVMREHGTPQVPISEVAARSGLTPEQVSNELLAASKRGEANLSPSTRGDIENPIVHRGGEPMADVEFKPQALGAGPTTEQAPVQVRAMQAGEESLAADKAVLDEPPPAMPAPMHDDLVAAALKRADDHDAPSPQATAAIEGPPGSIDPELQARIQQANPRNAEEAMAAADQALDDFGRRDGMAEMRRQMVEAKALEDETTEAWRTDETREKPGRKDIRNKVPMVDRNGKEVMWSERQVASYGKLDELKADLIRSCK